MSDDIDIDDPPFQAAVQEIMASYGVTRSHANEIAARRFGGKGDVIIIDANGQERSVAEMCPIPKSWRPKTI